MEDEIMDIDHTENEVDNQISGEEELFNAIRSLSDEEDEDSDEVESSTEDEDDEESDIDDEDDEYEDEIEEPTPPKKRVQTREENARFAARRREQELEKKVNERLEQLKQEAPEFKLAQQLSKQFGKPVDEIISELREAELRKEAQEKNVSLDFLRERQQERERLTALEEELNQLRFQNWQTKIKSESETLKAQYPVLSDDDMDSAIDYILHTVGNVNIPLEDAIYAVHGKKIIESLANKKVQDNLAEQSGRVKKTPLTPKTSGQTTPKTLTSEERFIAKQFGMSVEDYIKYKSS